MLTYLTLLKSHMSVGQSMNIVEYDRHRDFTSIQYINHNICCNLWQYWCRHPNIHITMSSCGPSNFNCVPTNGLFSWKWIVYDFMLHVSKFYCISMCSICTYCIRDLMSSATGSTKVPVAALACIISYICISSIILFAHHQIIASVYIYPYLYQYLHNAGRMTNCRNTNLRL
jgi:hypothetical protein